jgi:hypothetical protein
MSLNARDTPTIEEVSPGMLASPEFVIPCLRSNTLLWYLMWCTSLFSYIRWVICVSVCKTTERMKENLQLVDQVVFNITVFGCSNFIVMIPKNDNNFWPLNYLYKSSSCFRLVTCWSRAYLIGRNKLLANKVQGKKRIKPMNSIFHLFL